MKNIVFISLLALVACGRPLFKESWLNEQAPEQFTVRFITSRGDIDAQFTRAWSPLAVDRVYAQVKHGLYDHTLFYRVVPGGVAQFGTDDSTRRKLWMSHKLVDEPVRESNVRGTVAFARSGRDSRTTNLFINLRDNKQYDTISYSGATGFPVLGRVVSDMAVVDSLYKGYGNKVGSKYDSLFISKERFLASFPKLDSIKRAVILRSKK